MLSAVIALRDQGELNTLSLLDLLPHGLLCLALFARLVHLLLLISTIHRKIFRVFFFWHASFSSGEGLL